MIISKKSLLSSLKYSLPDFMTDQNTKSIKFLRDGFKQDFFQFVANSKKFDKLLIDLSEEFVKDNIPIVNDELKLEMALLLKESIYIDNP